MKKYNRFFAGMIILATILSTTAPAFALSNSSLKEEVIYIITDASGDINSTYVVNIFGSGEVVDYGEYISVKMLTTDDVIKHDGDMISFNASADKVYYQGNVESAELPWKISLRYFIDGVEYMPQEVAGKSGKLEIKFKVTENENCDSTFYDNYALQASFSLDTDICSGIVTDGATVANAGSKKQLLYTILPGKGIDTSITADVIDFEMDSVAINGLKLNLSIDNMSSDISGNILELKDAIEKIDDGANMLSDGADRLMDGGFVLQNGVDSLSTGAYGLNDGIIQLQAGIKTVQTGIEALNAQSNNLTGASSQVKSALIEIQTALASVSITAEDLSALAKASESISIAINQLYKGTEELYNQINYNAYKNSFSTQGLDIDQLESSNTIAIEDLSAQIIELKTTLAQVNNIDGNENQVAELAKQIAQLENIVMLLNGNNKMINGTELYLGHASDGIETIMKNLQSLNTEYKKFNEVISQLVNSLGSLAVNMSRLSAGIDEIINKYDMLDNGIINYTAGVQDVARGFLQLSNGALALTNGSKNLLDGVNELESGSNTLVAGISELSNKTCEFSSKTSELRDKTSDLDIEVNNKINDVLSALQPDDTEVVSFVSEKNTNVKSVQFVIKTSAIKIPEVSVEHSNTVVELSFWHKLLRLFGLY